MSLTEWNEYRKRYPTLTFKEKKQAHEAWIISYPKQTGYIKNLQFFYNCIDNVKNRTKKENLSIVEFGGYDGGLAASVLRQNRHLKWRNIELTTHISIEALKNYDYQEHVLENEVWIEKPNFKDHDVFLSSSTLEHISDEEFIQLFDYVQSQGIKYLVLLITVTREGSDWKNYGGSHVLRIGSNDIRKMLIELGYELIEEKGVYKWCSFWIYDGKNRR